jgi:hypothetical protein
MRTLGILAIMAVCATAAGCSGFVRSIERNFTVLPLQGFDECRMKCRNHLRAVEAWDMLEESSPEHYTPDFADGFVAGYADYLDNGGNGDPPAIPPFRYRTVKYQTPDGVEAINQWYAGWRHGTLMAKASGMRELEVIPLSAPPINAVPPDNDVPGTLSPPQPLPPPEQLPNPRPIAHK